MIELTTQVVAYLLASADIAGMLDLAFLVLGHVLVVATKRGDNRVAAVLVVIIGFTHDCLLCGAGGLVSRALGDASHIGGTCLYSPGSRLLTVIDS